jgi:hypothetical protein
MATDATDDLLPLRRQPVAPYQFTLYKESEMPEHRPAPDAPGRAALATIQRIKAEIVSHPDPETLNEIRAAFRREIPLHLRSYAAALLVLEASGGARQGRRNDGKRGEGRGRQEAQRPGESRKGDDRKGEGRRTENRKAEGRREDGGQRRDRNAPQAPELPSEETRPRFTGEGTTVFFGMGKRQRLYPRVLLRILTEDGGIPFERIGDIRSFDNYSFADIDPEVADKLIATLDGLAFRGRGLPVSRARKRGAPDERDASSPALDAGADEEADAAARDEDNDVHSWDDDDQGEGSSGFEELDEGEAPLDDDAPLPDDGESDGEEDKGL